jgi:hypothetical protein
LTALVVEGFADANLGGFGGSAGLSWRWSIARAGFEQQLG